jgi:hypothetical protein
MTLADQTPDERCALLFNTEHDPEWVAEDALRAVSAIDAERCDRLILASLQENDEAREYLLEQIPRCRCCYEAMMVRLAGVCASLHELQFGHNEAAELIAGWPAARAYGCRSPLVLSCDHHTRAGWPGVRYAAKRSSFADGRGQVQAYGTCPLQNEHESAPDLVRRIRNGSRLATVGI